jgi:hypothetical protein
MFVARYLGDEMGEDEMGKSCSNTGEMRSVYKMLVRKLVEKSTLNKTTMYGRIILKWILKEQSVRM